MKYFCKESKCNNKICYDTWKYGQGRCYSCAKSGNRNYNFRKKMNLKQKENIRIKLIKYPKIYNKQFLKKEYIQKGLNIYQIAKKIGCNKETVRKQLIKYNIKRRPGGFKHGKTMKKHHCSCGKQITYQGALYGSGKCRSCVQSIKMKGRLTGKKNPSYIHGQGYAPYPITFNKNLKYNIRTKDNFKCKKCGITEEEHIIIYGKVLDVHHIDYNKENCKETNLITLCNGCNLRVNYNREYWKNYFQEKIYGSL